MGFQLIFCIKCISKLVYSFLTCVSCSVESSSNGSCLCCHEDGMWLLEVNRLLRAGGYFVWAAQPVYKHEEVLEEQWEGKIE